MSSRLASVAVFAMAVTLAQVACDSGGEMLVAVIQLEPGMPATCLTLTVSEPDTVPARVLSETHVVRAAGQDEYRIAVYRAQLPAEVVLQAQALVGSDCAVPLSPVSSSEAARRRFGGGAPALVPLSISRPTVPPDGLALRLASPVLYAGNCVAASVETTLGGANHPVLADTAVSLSAQPGSGLTTHVDGTCGAVASGGTIPAWGSALPFQLRGLDAGQYTLAATAAGLDSGTAFVNVLLTPPTALAFRSAPWTALAGSCLGPARIQPVDGSGRPSLLAQGAMLDLSADASGVTFATDPGCSATTTAVSLPAGAPEAVFYFRSRAIGPVTLRVAASGLGTATQAEQIIPSVRAGSCNLPLGVVATSCGVSLPAFDVSKAFLIAQAISNDNTPGGVNVRCSLADAGAIYCSRSAGSGWADVSWQLVELASGIRVQRLKDDNCFQTPPAPDAGTYGNPATLPSPFNPAQTFSLFTAEGGGGIVDFNDYRTVRLVGNDQVEVLNSTDCGSGIVDVQAIDLAGATVERGVLDAGATPVTVTTGTAADLGRTVLLHSARFTGSTLLCGYQLRGTLSSPTAITFTRGDGNDAACQAPDITAISWERIQLPPGFTVQQLQVVMGAGESSAVVPLSPPVDPARSFAFASSQPNAGQGFGETSYNGDDTPGVAGARHRIGGGGSQLELTRGLDAGTARWTSYVVQLP